METGLKIDIRAAVEGQEESTADLLLYDVIGKDWMGEGITASAVASALDQAKTAGAKTINVKINSPGGNVFEGLAIYNELAKAETPVNVTVMGIAASAASVIAMAGDKITMAQGSMMMIHNAAGLVMGNAADMQAMAESLEKIDGGLAGIYAKRSGRRESTMRGLMNMETWMTAQEAVDNKLADEVEARGKGRGAKAKALASIEDMADWPESWKRIAASFRTAPESLKKQFGFFPAANPPKTIIPPEPPVAEIESEDEVMEMKDLTLEGIKSARPDLITSLASEVKTPLVEAHATAITAAVESGVKEERKRCLAIAKEARALALLDEGEKLIEGGKSIDAAASELKGKRLEAISAAAPGSPGSEDGGENAGGAIERWNAALDSKVKAGLSKPKAISTLAREQPELHQAYLKAYNAKHVGQRKNN